MPVDESAGPTAPKKHWKYWFLREDFDASTRPRLERSEGGRAQRRLAKKKWDREEGGRFRTWVYVAALLIIIIAWAVLIFG